MRPTRLRNGDRVSLGSTVRLVFRQSVTPEEQRAHSMQCHTAQEVREERRWLLIADLAGFSDLSKSLPPAELATVVGNWLVQATALIQRHGGRINKYTGDGFIAFWRDQLENAQSVAAALLGFRELAGNDGLAFRIVVHVGVVVVGGAPSLGEESLLSDDLSFTFRLEKLAGTLGTGFLLSPDAVSALGTLLPLLPISGRHELKGFPLIEGLATVAQFGSGSRLPPLHNEYK